MSNLTCPCGHPYAEHSSGGICLYQCSCYGGFEHACAALAEARRTIERQKEGLGELNKLQNAVTRIGERAEKAEAERDAAYDEVRMMGDRVERLVAANRRP